MTGLTWEAMDESCTCLAPSFDCTYVVGETVNLVNPLPNSFPIIV